ncbi:hypothetical protein KW791_01435 [Candidatus Parcubacteria bacterium]|nr:hypothetical protein [Candidatus Parcubacteria bacterium]
MNGLEILLGIVIIANALISIYVLTRNYKGIVNRSFFIFGSGITLWSIGIFAIFVTHVFLFDKAILYGGLMIVWGLGILAWTFPNHNYWPKNGWLFFIPLAVAAFLIPFGVFINGQEMGPHGPSPINGPWFPFYVGVLGVYIAASFLILIYRYRKSSGLVRLQMRYLFTGAILFVGIGFTTNAILPARGIFNFNLLGPISSVIFIGFTAYSIVRHQLMNIRVVIQRGLIYLISVVGVSGIYFVVIFSLGSIIQRGTDIAHIISGLISAVIGVIAFPYFKESFERSTEKIFFKTSYSYFNTLKELSQALSSTLDLRELDHRIRYIISTKLKAKIVLLLTKRSDGSLKIFNDENLENHDDLLDLARLSLSFPDEIIVCRELQSLLQAEDPKYEQYSKLCSMADKLNIGVLIQIKSQDEVIALIMIGKKMSDDDFVQKDIDLLSIFSHQAGVTFKNAQLYDEIRRSNIELEDRIKERTGELQHLYQAQTRFMADISHELQTPLAIMKGNAELLQGRDKIVETIRETLDSMSQLVNNLLAMAKFEFGYNFKQETVCLDHLLGRVFEDFEALAQDRQIKFILDIPKGSYCVVGDREKLKELFLNLISNGLKYTGAGGSITLSLERTKSAVVVRVIDTGIGIASEDLPHVFERFYRSQKSGITRGVGLGLAICKQIVEAHHGTIEVKSIEHHGSEFIVSLPVTS